MVIETRQILEEFELKNVLATSATGAVFLAQDPNTGRDVVIKLVSCSVPNAEDEIRGLFLSMVEMAKAGEVPSMPLILDYGLTPEGDGFLIMEEVSGQTLDSIDELDPVAALNVVIDVLGCVEGLARAGTAHLNLTSANVFVTHQPVNDRAVVLGFGTAATLRHAGVGAPVPAEDPHLAPELVAGNALSMNEAWRSDLFSLGVIACSAFGAEIVGDGYERPTITLPPSVRAALAEPEHLEAMLAQIMEPDPMRRGTSPSEVRDTLIRALPDLPAAPMSVAPEAAGTPPVAFDPNKTDPAFVVAQQTASGPTRSVAIDAKSAEVKADDSVDGEPAPDEDHGWPEILFGDPELPGSLEARDDLEDTDISNPVPQDVWVPAAAALGPEPVAVPPATGRRVPRWELALVAAVVVILGSIIALTWPRVGRNEPVPVVSTPVNDATRREPLVPPPPDSNLFDDLLAIQQLVDVGDLDEARRALDLFDQREAVSLSSDEAALYDSLVASLTRAVDRNAAFADLHGGLANGNVTMLRRAVAGLSGLTPEEMDEVPGLADDLDRARTAVLLHGKMWQAHKDGDHLGTIAGADRLVEVLPGYTSALDLKNQAAEELEARAEGYIVSHEYGNAVSVLESLQRVWPEREGVASRIAWCRTQVEANQRAETAIARAVAKGDAGDPESGLEALAAISYDPRLQGSVDQARSRLEARLAELDATAPTIEIATSRELAFKKNQTITIPLKVADDFRIDRVVVHARNESDDGYLQIPLAPDEAGLYDFTVAPDLHGNQDVYFYVVAVDPSGHVGRLGAEDEPIKVERAKWYHKIGD